MSQTKAQLIGDLVQALAFTATASAPTNGMFLSASNTLAISTNSSTRLTVNGSGQIDFNSNSRIEEDGLFKTAHGSAATPSHAFLNDPDNGMFRATTNTLGFQLVVVSACTSTALDRFKSAAATDAGDRLLQIQGNSSSTADILIAHSVASASQSSSISFAPANNVTGGKIACHAEEDFSVSANRTARLEFYTRKDGTLSEKLRIDSSGNVGIGTSSPTVLLDLESTSPTIRLTDSDATALLNVKFLALVVI